MGPYKYNIATNCISKCIDVFSTYCPSFAHSSEHERRNQSLIKLVLKYCVSRYEHYRQRGVVGLQIWDLSVNMREVRCST